MSRSRRSYYLKTIQEIIGPEKLWPIAIKHLVYRAKHLNNVQRFKVTVFFLCNGLHPDYICGFYQSTFNMDAEAARHVMYIIKKYPTSRWTAWNIHLGRSV